MTPVPAWLQYWKDIADAAASSATVVGVLVGGVWTYLLFIRRRQKYPRANIEHRVWHWQTRDKTVIHLAVRVTNVGEVIIREESVFVKVQQLLPIHPSVTAVLAAPGDPVPRNKSEIHWPEVATRECDWKADCREIEPGETDECIFDFILPLEIEKVSLYSYLRNHTKRGRDIGWSATTIYSLATKDERNGYQQSSAATINRSRSTQETVLAGSSEAEGLDSRNEQV